MTTLKKTYFYRVFCYFPFLVFFFFFLFLFSNIKKKKTKNAIFFSKTSFLITQNFAKTLFWHTVTLFVLQKKPKNTIKLGKTAKKNLDQFLTYNLDQFLTYKTPNLGPVFNFTAYIYVYIYIYFSLSLSLSLPLPLSGLSLVSFFFLSLSPTLTFLC